MHTFSAFNTNDLMPIVYEAIDTKGYARPSRNGPVLRLPGPTCVTLTRPWQRVNFAPGRDCNPFFHVVEGAAMLAGDVGNDVTLLSYFAKNMASFSDDGETYNSFYGTRMRSHWGYDQLHRVIEELRMLPDSRHAVVNIWDSMDQMKQTKDKACNMTLLFEVDEFGRVSMTSFNRSNDAIWGGVSGANVVHLSMFHEFVAIGCNRTMGVWHHISNNLHVYTNNPKWPGVLNDNVVHLGHDYPGRVVPLYAGINSCDHTVLTEDLRTAVARLKIAVRNTDQHTISWVNAMLRERTGSTFVDKVLMPMAAAYIYWKSGYRQLAYEALFTVKAQDWRLAGLLWFKRRQDIVVAPTYENANEEGLFNA